MPTQQKKPYTHPSSWHTNTHKQKLRSPKPEDCSNPRKSRILTKKNVTFPLMNFPRLFFSKAGWKEDSRAELSHPQSPMQWRCCCKTSRLCVSPGQRAAGRQVESRTALAALLSDLGLARSRGSRASRGQGSSAGHITPSQHPARQTARQRAAPACSPSARRLAPCPASSGISAHGSFSISLHASVTPKKTWNTIWQGSVSLAEGTVSVELCFMHALTSSVACSPLCRLTQKSSQSEGQVTALTTYVEMLLKAVIAEKWLFLDWCIQFLTFLRVWN